MLSVGGSALARGLRCHQQVLDTPASTPNASRASMSVPSATPGAVCLVPVPARRCGGGGPVTDESLDGSSQASVTTPPW